MNCSATRSPASRAVIGESGDLRGDALLLIERERDRLDVVREGRLRRRDGRDHDLSPASRRYCTIIIAWFRSSTDCR